MMQKEVLSFVDGILDIKFDELHKTSHIVKSAELERIVEQSLRVNPVPSGYMRLLINALGAGEYWSFNKRGDYFREDMLNPKEYKFGLEYGYKTYEKYGYVYPMHMRSKEMRLGKVAAAFWVDDLKRVFVLADVDRNKTKGYIDIVKNGSTIPTSMGASVKFDACSICAPSYETLTSMPPDTIREMHFPGVRFSFAERPCEHVPAKVLEKDAQTGEIVYLDNYYPVFKDISIVLSPADEVSSVIMKVAHEYVSFPIRPPKVDIPPYLQQHIEYVKKDILPASVRHNDTMYIKKIANSLGKRALPIFAELGIPLTYFEFKIISNSMPMDKKAYKDVLGMFLLKRGSHPVWYRLRLRDSSAHGIVKIAQGLPPDFEYIKFILTAMKSMREGDHFSKVASYCGYPYANYFESNEPFDIHSYIYLLKVAGCDDPTILLLLRRYDLI